MRGRVSACAKKIYFAENLSQVGMSSSPLVLSQYFQLHNKFLSTIGNKKCGYSINFIAQQFVALSSGTFVHNSYKNELLCHQSYKTKFPYGQKPFVIIFQ